MQSKYTNKNGVKLLAAVMAFAMVFVAGFALIGGEDSSVDATTGDNIKYFSGTLDGLNEVPSGTIAYVDKDTKIITDNQKTGSIVVRNGGYLKIDSGVTLTVSSKSSSINTITENPSASQYVGMITATTFGGLVIEKGAIVVIDGNVVVDKDGVVYNSAEYITPTTSNKVMGSGPGLFVNGTVTVEKGGEISSASTISSSAAISSKASDTTYINQMIISSTGSVLFKSTSATSSKVNNQTFSIMDGGILTIDALVNGNVIIGSFSTSSYAITSKVAIGTEKSVNDITAYSWTTSSGTTNQGEVNLSFSVSTEKAEKMYVSSSVSSKYSYAILDISGSVDDNATLVTLDNCFRTIEVAKSTGTTSTGIKAYGITEVSKNLEINKGAYFATIGLSNVIISGNIDIDGTKELKANVIMAGIHTVSGTVTIGKVNGAIDGNNNPGIQYAWATNATATTNFFIYKDACFIMIDGNGEVSIDGYNPSSFGTGSYSQQPEGTLGVTFIDSDDVFHITNLEKAVAADNDDEITINAIAKKTWIMDEKKFVIDSDFTLPENLEITVINTVLVKDGVTLTRSEGAELTSINGTYGVIEVVGYYYDYNVEDVQYIPASPSTSYQYVYIKAEVKSIDAAETYYMYTSLENSLTEPADGTIITLFGNVEISKNMTIPENVTVKTGGKYIQVNKEKELTVDGVLIIETGPVYLIYGTDGTDNAKLIVNNMVVGPSKIYKGTAASGTAGEKVAGIYADGTIGDDYTGPFLLNPAVAAANSKTLNNMEVLAKTTYAGSLTFVADEDNTDPTIDIKATATFGKITLDGYGIIVASDNTSSGVLTAEIIAETTSGSASVLVENLATKKLNISVSEDDSGETTVTKLTVTTDTNTTLSGNMNITSGVVYISGTIDVGSYDESTKISDVLTISSGAELVVPNSSVLNVEDNAAGTPLDFAGLVVDGKLSITKGGDFNILTDTAIAGYVVVNGELFITGTDQDVSGTLVIIGKLTVDTNDKTKAKLTIRENLVVGTAPETLGSNATITGALSVPNTTSMVVYPGSDITGAIINYDSSTGECDLYSTDFVVDGTVYLSRYGNSTATIGAIPDMKIVGYETIVGDSTAANTKWYTEPEFKNIVSASMKIKDHAQIYADATASEAQIKISVGSGISLWIDGVKYFTGSTVDLRVGEYNVQATIDPGYKGTTKITFDGAQITNGKIIVTPEMSIEAPTTPGSNDYIILSATGEITSDAGTVIIPEDKDSGMGITDYLLIVLVILAAILVVIVAIRMMRS